MPPAPFLSRAVGRLRAAVRRAAPGRGFAGWSEPRRPDCPWCGSGRLGPGPAPADARRPSPWPALPAVRRPRGRPAATPDARPPAAPLDVADLPAGTVPFDTCADCGHVFQNPRRYLWRDPCLTAEELTPYPHGITGPTRRLAARRHRSAARALLSFPEPESWLDVGTGDGDFPAVARGFFPYTAFDGVDAGHRVVRAQAADRVEEAHLGRLTDPHLTARLRDRYDVVTMLHHLEGAPDPRAELRAALTVLRPGGHLLLDLTDPRAGRWTPPARPAPLHLPPRANIEAELRANGCTPLTTKARAPLSGAYRVLARRD
ncbi:methyltransferase domain-containing protein [Streptomyces sp. NPDC005925]|uniref:class I SAM-dependent methyltransferase n=1 Tax=Streptomyces sp. NPDC005925 TaxID=3157172 RepID=UPI0033E7B757